MKHLSNEEKKVVLYVTTLMKKEGVFNYFVDENIDIVKELIFTLIKFKKSDIFNNNIDEDTFINICLGDRLKEIIVYYHYDFEDEWLYDSDKIESKSVELSEILLSVIYKYVIEYMEYTELEMDSFIIFGKNLFYEIRYETSTLSITI